MSIDILTGVPGSGKSYYAVHTIYHITQSQRKFLVLHNIEGLNLCDNRVISIDWKLSDFSAESMSDRLRLLRDEYKLESDCIIYIYVDEAQRFFPPELKDAQVFYFFDYHRHFGVNVVLITQHEKKLSFKLSSLAESEIRAVSQKINPLGSFVYKCLAGGEHYATKRITKDKKIFGLYKSFEAGTGVSKKSNLRFIVMIVVVAAVLVWLVFFKVFAESFSTIKSNVRPDLAAVHAVNSAVVPVKPSTVQQNFSELPPDKSAAVESDFVGPEILDYDRVTDRVKIKLSDSDLHVWLSVSQYIVDYPPQIYGYGYFHSKNKKFVVTSSLTKDFIFPVKNALTAVNKIPMPKNYSMPVYDAWEDRKFARPHLTDDDRMMEHWRTVFASYNNRDRYTMPRVPEFPAWAKKGKSEVSNSINSTKNIPPVM